MNVEVQLFAYLRNKIPGLDAEGRRTVSLPVNSKVSDLLRALGIEAAGYKLVFLNGVHCTEDNRLSEGDEISIFPPIAGG